MSDTGHLKCPRCGKELTASAPEGLCPACLAGLNFATETNLSGADLKEALTPMTPAELAPHFPQLEILECLGRGGMGVVYKARQKSLNRLVALKLLAPERVQDAKFAERFAREAHALAALNHPNIVTVHDFGQAGGFYFLLMEFVDGVNLRQLLRSRKLQSAEALAIVPPVCEALQYAHEHGIVHRDIKPENLLLAKDGRVKIADFGIAKILGTPAATAGSEVEEKNTAAADAATQHTTMGTPQYMAPEQREQPQAADHRADIYSLGVVLYELLTGELPTDKLQPPSRKVQIDVRLDEIVLRALEKTPELRYQTAGEFKTQVEMVGEKERSPAQEDITPAKSGPIPRELKVIVGWMMVQGGLALVNSIFAFISWGQIFLNLLVLHLLIGFGLLSLKAGWWRAAVAMNGIQLFASLVGVPLVMFAGSTAGNMLSPGENFREQPVVVGVMVLIQCVLVIACALVHFTLMRLRREGWFGPVSRKHGTAAFPVAVVVFYAGVILGIMLIGVLSFRFNRDSAYLLVVGMMAVVSPFVGVMTGNALRQAEQSKDQGGLARIKGRLKALSVVAWVLALPVVGFAIFFFLGMLSERGGWNPATSEAVLVPLTWLGAVLLPWSACRLWNESRAPKAKQSMDSGGSEVMAWMAFGAAFMSGLIPTVFHWFAEEVVPATDAAVREQMLWFGFFLSLIAIVLGIAAIRSKWGLAGFVVGLVNAAIWVVLYSAGNFHHAWNSRPVARDFPYQQREPSKFFTPEQKIIVNDISARMGKEGFGLRVGSITLVRSGPDKNQDLRHHYFQSSRADFLVDQVMNHRLALAPGMKFADFPYDWDTATLDEVSKALETDAVGVEHQVSNGDRFYYLPRKADLPRTFAIQTADGYRGLVQLISTTENPPGLKLRYKRLRLYEPHVVRSETQPLRTGKPVTGVVQQVPTKFAFPVWLILGVLLLGGLFIGGLVLMVWLARKNGLKGCLFGGLVAGAVMLAVGLLVVLVYWGSSVREVRQRTQPITTLELSSINPNSPRATPNGLAMQVQNGFNLKVPPGQLVTFEVFIRHGDDRREPVPALTAVVATDEGDGINAWLSWMGKREDDGQGTNQLWSWSVNGNVLGAVPMPNRTDYGTNMAWHVKSREVLNWWQLAMPQKLEMNAGSIQEIALFRTFGSATMDPALPKEIIARIKRHALPEEMKMQVGQYQMLLGLEAFEKVDAWNQKAGIGVKRVLETGAKALTGTATLVAEYEQDLRWRWRVTKQQPARILFSLIDTDATGTYTNLIPSSLQESRPGNGDWSRAKDIVLTWARGGTTSVLKLEDQFISPEPAQPNTVSSAVSLQVGQSIRSLTSPIALSSDHYQTLWEAEVTRYSADGAVKTPRLFRLVARLADPTQGEEVFAFAENDPVKEIKGITPGIVYRGETQKAEAKKPEPAPLASSEAALRQVGISKNSPTSASIKVLDLTLGKSAGPMIMLESATRLEPGEKVFVSTRDSSGKVQNGIVNHLIMNGAEGKSSLILIWMLPFNFFDEGKAVRAELGRYQTGHPLTLTNDLSQALFSVTNAEGAILYGEIRYDRNALSKDAAKAEVKVNVSADSVRYEGRNLNAEISLIMPSGCQLHATSWNSGKEPGEAIVFLTDKGAASEIRGSVSWSWPLRLDEKAGAMVVQQIKNRVGKGSLILKLGQPVEMFSVTNAAGTTFTGSLELVGNKP